MIQLEGLSKAFGSVQAVDNLSVTMPSGAVTAVLGLNGAGKTTLLRMIAGIEHADRGQITINGRDVRDQPDPARLLGVHWDPSAMDLRHTADRHLRWLAALSGFERSRVPTVLQTVGLDGQQRRRIGGLSAGARQRLGIASALLGDPPVLILDEPVNGLDVPGIVWLRNLLRDMADSGKTIVLSSHLLAEVALTADEILLLDRGRALMHGPLESLVPADTEPREFLEQELIATEVRS